MKLFHSRCNCVCRGSCSVLALVRVFGQILKVSTLIACRSRTGQLQAQVLCACMYATAWKRQSCKDVSLLLGVLNILPVLCCSLPFISCLVWTARSSYSSLSNRRFKTIAGCALSVSSQYLPDSVFAALFCASTMRFRTIGRLQ